MGYRKERYWWELVIALRKVTIVFIGTFGTLMGRTDLQAYVAILVVFISIVIHLVGKPFDTHKKDTKLLYVLEFLGLSVCFFTFWSGLIFYLGPDVVPQAIRHGMSVLIWVANVGFLLYAVKSYAYEYYRDEVKKKQARRKTMNKFEIAKDMIGATELQSWKVFPAKSDDESDGESVGESVGEPMNK